MNAANSIRWIGVLSIFCGVSLARMAGAAAQTTQQPSYPVTHSATELMTEVEPFQILAATLAADIERSLAGYTGSPMRQRLLRATVSISLLNRRTADPKNHAHLLARARELNADDLSALLLQAYVTALQQHDWPSTADAATRASFERNLLAPLERDDPSTRMSQVQSLLAKLPQWDAQVLRGMAHTTLQPTIDANQALSAELALQLIELRFIAEVLTPLRSEVQSALRTYQARHASGADFWTSRALALPAQQACKPLIIAVWDSGIDTSQFGGRLFVNAAERLDGADNDGNGFIDDVHGIAFDLSGAPTSQLLQPVSGLQLDRAATFRRMKGMLDAQAALDTAEARELAGTMRTLQPQQARHFRQELGLIGNYLHGTWVASIATDSNPCARLLVARTEFEYRLPPAPWSIAWAERMSANARRTIQYFADHDVRIVNMSWRLSRREVELNLEGAGLVLGAAERAAAAGATFERVRNALLESMRSASDILFVVSAGNSDAEISEVIPASFDLPNVLTVGAVDQYGQRAPFSNSGAPVDVHAPGVAVAGLAPGGQTVSWSGTSAAAPAVTNLASKLLVLDPQLSPPALAQLIMQQALAERSGAPPVIHPKRTAEYLQARTKHVSPAAR